jgi:hypothetical protein
MALPSGEPQVVVENALWPALSPDGDRLAYVRFDPEDYSNDLYVAAADGSGATRVLGRESFDAIDAVLFAPDGRKLVFSAVGEGPGPQPEPTPAPAARWLDWLMGVREAAAHDVPSDWWQVATDGGTPERLTRVYDTGLFGAFAPDAQYLAYISLTGLYVLDPDDGQPTPLLDVAGGGTVDWIH